jgi:hypothetical protein
MLSFSRLDLAEFGKDLAEMWMRSSLGWDESSLGGGILEEI